MKKLLLGALLLLSTLGFSQVLEYKEKVLSFSSENSQGVEFINRFNLDEKILTQLKTNDVFCSWERDMETEKDKGETISKLQSLFNQLKTNNSILIFLRNQVEIENMMAALQCKNQESFKVIENSKGNIYINDKNELIINENYSAKNGYGNDIPGKLFIVIDLNTGKSKLLL